MSFSAGVYTLPAGNPVTAGNTIESSWANTTLSDIATALSTCMLKDGTQTLTANIPMSGFRFTGLGAGSAANDSVRVAQLQNSTVQYVTGTAGTNTITASGTPTVTALAAGQIFRFIPANTNTGATTLQIDSTAATNVFWNNAAMVGGELRQNVPVEVFYDGTQYQLVGSAAMANIYSVPDVIRIQSSADRTKEMTFNMTGVAAGALVTMGVPGTGGFTIVGDTLTQTLTNKTLTSPTIDTLVTGSAVATVANMTAASAINLIVSPGRQQYHPSAPKAWGLFSCASAIVEASYPPTGVSVTRSGAGVYAVTFGVTMATANYPVIGLMQNAGAAGITTTSTRTTTTFYILSFSDAGVAADALEIAYAVHGNLA